MVLHTFVHTKCDGCSCVKNKEREPEKEVKILPYFWASAHLANCNAKRRVLVRLFKKTTKVLKTLVQLSLKHTEALDSLCCFYSLEPHSSIII